MSEHICRRPAKPQLLPSVALAEMTNQAACGPVSAFYVSAYVYNRMSCYDFIEHKHAFNPLGRPNCEVFEACNCARLFIV